MTTVTTQRNMSGGYSKLNNEEQAQEQASKHEQAKKWKKAKKVAKNVGKAVWNELHDTLETYSTVHRNFNLGMFGYSI